MIMKITHLLSITHLLLFCFLFNPIKSYSQCASGELSVSIDVITDTYGYEGYWELTPGTSACGTSTIAFGGNTVVGCTSGAQVQDPGGYGDNTVYTEGPWCLTEGAQYTLHYRDDWGDGGFQFRVRVGGFIIQSYVGTDLGGDYTFTVQNAPQYDIQLAGNSNSTQIMGYFQLAGVVDIKAFLTNVGTETITSLELNYQIDSEAPVTEILNNLSIGNYETQKVSFPSPWNTNDIGVHTVDFWISAINGQADENPGQENVIRYFEIGLPKPDIITSYQIANPTFEVIADNTDGISNPTDIDFHPTLTNSQLWVTNKGTANTGGTNVIINRAGGLDQTSELLQDGNAWHFMSLPTGIAFSDNGNFATSPGVFDANHQGTNSAFTGPTLWSGSLDVFAQPSGGNGSHLDMLHESPYSQGVAWEVDNAFWIFDGYSNDIVRYDFVIDHNPGNDDHSDAIVRRYADFEVQKDPTGVVPSHMILDEQKRWLYSVDNGNQRIIRIDITTGSVSSTAPSYGPSETMAEYVNITGYTWEEVVTTGLEKPAGIEIMGNHLLVGDYATGMIRVYNVSSMPASLEFTIQTPAQGLMGLVIAPNGNIIYADNVRNEIVRIVPAALGLNEVKKAEFSLFPNPSSGQFTVRSSVPAQRLNVSIFDVSGRMIESYQSIYSGEALNVDLNSGVYIVRLSDQGGNILKSIPLVIAD